MIKNVLTVSKYASLEDAIYIMLQNKVGVLPIETGREAEKKGELRLLTLMLGYTPIISHNSDGKPFIEGYNISISHTKGYVAIIISRFFEVGVDIEYPADRVLRIASRFLRDDEPFNDIDSCLTAWCAKEAVYNRIRRGSLKTVIENGTKFVILDEEPSSEKTTKTASKSTKTNATIIINGLI